MARPLRIEYADAVYHVIMRGNQGQAIVRDDRRCFLKTVGELWTGAGVFTRVTQTASRVRWRGENWPTGNDSCSK